MGDQLEEDTESHDLYERTLEDQYNYLILIFCVILLFCLFLVDILDLFLVKMNLLIIDNIFFLSIYY